MKKNQWIIIAIVGVIGVALWYWYNQNKKTNTDTTSNDTSLFDNSSNGGVHKTDNTTPPPEQKGTIGGADEPKSTPAPSDNVLKNFGNGNYNVNGTIRNIFDKTSTLSVDRFVVNPQGGVFDTSIGQSISVEEAQKRANSAQQMLNNSLGYKSTDLASVLPKSNSVTSSTPKTQQVEYYEMKNGVRTYTGTATKDLTTGKITPNVSSAKVSSAKTSTSPTSVFQTKSTDLASILPKKK